MEILSDFCNVEYTPICRIYKKIKQDLYTPTNFNLILLSKVYKCKYIKIKTLLKIEMY
jgi:hypothetical protein